MAENGDWQCFAPQESCRHTPPCRELDYFIGALEQESKRGRLTREASAAITALQKLAYARAMSGQ